MNRRLHASVFGSLVLLAACSQSQTPIGPSRTPLAVAPVAQVAAETASASASSLIGRLESTAVLYAALGAPTNLIATVTASTVTLRWTASTDPLVVNYMIEAGTAPNLANLARFSSAGTSFGGTAPNGTYYVRIRSVDARGNLSEQATNEVVVVVGVDPPACDSPPNSPTDLTSSVMSSLLTLTWKAPIGGCAPESYVIEAGSTTGATDLANFDTGNTNTTFSTDLGSADQDAVALIRASAAYSGPIYVRIKARNKRGRSGPSNTTTVTRGAPPINCLDEWLRGHKACYDLYSEVFGKRVHCLGNCTRALEGWFQACKRGAQSSRFVPPIC